MKRVLNGIVIPFIGYWLMLLISLTLRPRRIHGEETLHYLHNNPAVLAFWHSRIFYMPRLLRRHGKLYALVSPSSDGDIIHGILRRFGFLTVRGSSFRRGAQALLALAKLLRKGNSAAMIADGSRGPALAAQPGSVYLAKLTGHPIIPLAWGAERKKELGTWDRTIIPLPFSRINIAVGYPISVPKDITEEGIEQKRKELEMELARITALADDFS